MSLKLVPNIPILNKDVFGQKPTTRFGIEIQTLTIRFLNDFDLKIILTLR